MNRKQENTTRTQKNSGSALLGILALISVVCFLALVVMQALEFMTYGD
jgi:hypothetical protein